MKWFRIHHSLFSENTKFKRLSFSEKGRYFQLYYLASKSSTRGLVLDDDDDIAYELDMEVEDWQTLKSKFRAKGFIEHDTTGGFWISAWEDEQYESDSSTERVRRHRAKKKKQEKRTCNVSSPLPEQRVTPPDPDPDPFSQPPEQEGKKEKTAAEEKSYPDPLAAQFAPKRWMKNGKLRPELLEFVARQFSDDMDMNPRTAARNHLLNLNKSASPNDKEILEGYCDDLEWEQRKTLTQSALTAEESSRILQKQLREMTDATNKNASGPVRKAPATQHRRRSLCT